MTRQVTWETKQRIRFRGGSKEDSGESLVRGIDNTNFVPEHVWLLSSIDRLTNSVPSMHSFARR